MKPESENTFRSFKEYEDPFKNAADFDDDDSPEVPADSMRK